MALVHLFSLQSYIWRVEKGRSRREKKKGKSLLLHISGNLLKKAFIPRKLLFLQTADSLETLNGNPAPALLCRPSCRLRGWIKLASKGLLCSINLQGSWYLSLKVYNLSVYLDELHPRFVYFRLQSLIS